MKNAVLILISLTFTGCGELFLTKNPKDGVNGHSAVFKLLTADSTVCPAGGSIMSAGIDLNDDALLQPEETKSVLVACNGQQGATGAAGTNATSVTIVPLCPGVSNYGTFIEIGLCMNSKLYGVYSANNGFLTYLASGSYSSNAIGSACNLVINGCTVSH